MRLQNKPRRPAGQAPAEQPHGRAAANSRDRGTWTLYGLLGLVGFLLTAIGAVLAPLQRDLGVDRAQVAFYPSLFAIGLLVVGLVGPPVVGAIGRVVYSRLALALMVTGALGLSSGNRPVTMAGAALLGLGAAGVVQLVPAALTEAHGTSAAASLGEANALSSAAAVAGPLCVGAAIGLGAGWRIGFLALPLAAAVVLAPFTRSLPPAGPAVRRRDLASGGGPPDGPLLGVWCNLLLAISVEFCIVFWAPDALMSWHDAGAGAAAALAAAFVIGMALVRTSSARLLAGHDPRTMTALSAIVAMAGFMVFWGSPSLFVAALGLLILGGGVALLYPISVANVVGAWPGRPDAAAGRAALASALAIGGAPLALAAMAEVIGLRAAYLLVPALLGLLLVRVTCHTVRR